jgi:hypothetical protein
MWSSTTAAAIPMADTYQNKTNQKNTARGLFARVALDICRLAIFFGGANKYRQALRRVAAQPPKRSLQKDERR